jgi:hypothetical protein
MKQKTLDGGFKSEVQHPMEGLQNDRKGGASADQLNSVPIGM